MSDELSISENIYGHAKRLEWIKSRVGKTDRILEVGCGTGYMICMPLLRAGYDVKGLDRDEKSIAYGREMLHKEGLDAERIVPAGISDLDWPADVIIVSEVLEHIPTPDLAFFLGEIREKLNPGGKLFVTVPNGRGWFEMESFFWSKLGLGRLVELLRIPKVIIGLKKIFLGSGFIYPYLSFLDGSPHIQRFTFGSIQRLLNGNGWRVKEITGSVLFAGPFSSLFFTGVKPVMKLNCLLGKWFPRIAAGFYLACERRD
ncbi:MAG: class I SAM-dependent methyltransferase [bacterium]